MQTDDQGTRTAQLLRAMGELTLAQHHTTEALLLVAAGVDTLTGLLEGQLEGMLRLTSAAALVPWPTPSPSRARRGPRAGGRDAVATDGT